MKPGRMPAPFETTTMRVPKEFLDQVKAYSKRLIKRKYGDWRKKALRIRHKEQNISRQINASKTCKGESNEYCNN